MNLIIPPSAASRRRTSHPRFPTRWLAVVALVLALWLPSPAFAGPIRIVCDGAVTHSVRNLLASSEAQLRGVGATVLPAIEATDAVNALIDDHLDILIIADPAPLPNGGPPLKTIDWVRTPVVVAAHDQVPVNNLKRDELMAILSGWFTHWPDGTPVRLLLPPASSRDLAELRSASPALANAIDQALKRPGLTVVSSDEELGDLLQTVPGSIGFTTLAFVRSEKPFVKPLELDGVEPSPSSERLGLYRLQRVISVITRNPPSRPVATVVAFLLAEEHHPLLLRNGLIPASASTGPLD